MADSKTGKLPSGWGILADDLAAGLIAAVFVLVAIYFWPDLFG